MIYSIKRDSEVTHKLWPTCANCIIVRNPIDIFKHRPRGTYLHSVDGVWLKQLFSLVFFKFALIQFRQVGLRKRQTSQTKLNSILQKGKWNSNTYVSDLMNTDVVNMRSVTQTGLFDMLLANSIEKYIISSDLQYDELLMSRKYMHLLTVIVVKHHSLRHGFGCSNCHLTELPVLFVQNIFMRYPDNINCHRKSQ